MLGKLLSAFVPVLLVFSNIPAWGMDCCQAAAAAPSCCCDPMGSDSGNEENNSPLWTPSPCHCHTVPAPKQESKPILDWRASPSGFETFLDPDSAVLQSDLKLFPSSLGYPKDRQPRAPPCPLYRLYGVYLN